MAGGGHAIDVEREVQEHSVLINVASSAVRSVAQSLLEEITSQASLVVHAATGLIILAGVTELGKLTPSTNNDEEPEFDQTPDVIETADANNLSIQAKLFAFLDPLLWHFFTYKYGSPGVSLLEEAFRRGWTIEPSSFYWGKYDFDHRERRILFEVEEDPYDSAKNLYDALVAGLLGPDAPVISPPYDGEVRYRDLAKTWRNEHMSRALERAEAQIWGFVEDTRNDVSLELATGGVGGHLWFTLIRRGDDVVDVVHFVDQGRDLYRLSGKSAKELRDLGITAEALERGFQFRNIFNGFKQSLRSLVRRSDAASFYAEVRVLNQLAARGDELLAVGDLATRAVLTRGNANLVRDVTRELRAAKLLYTAKEESGGLVADFISVVGRRFKVAEVKYNKNLADAAASALSTGRILEDEWSQVRHAIDQVVVTATALKKASKSAKLSHLEVYLPKPVVDYLTSHNMINGVGSIPLNSRILGEGVSDSSSLLRIDGVLINIKAIAE